MFKQGDIVSVYFPFTDGTTFKKRPALVISNEKVNKTGDYLIAQITSKVYTDELSVNIEDTDCTKAMPFKSYVRSHKLFTIHQNRILAKFSSAKSSLMKKVIDKIEGNLES